MPHRLAPIALALWMAAALAAGPAQAQSTASDSTSAESMLIVTRVDTRKCAYPQCGGYFVKAVNVARTRCADGTLQKECHAVQLNTLALGWSPEQPAAFEAQLAAGQAMAADGGLAWVRERIANAASEMNDPPASPSDDLPAH